jgi:hypothetical protein
MEQFLASLEKIAARGRRDRRLYNRFKIEPPLEPLEKT